MVNNVNVLLVSPMYPSVDFPAYGIFVKELEGRLAEGHGVRFTKAVRTYKDRPFTLNYFPIWRGQPKLLYWGCLGNMMFCMPIQLLMQLRWHLLLD